MKRLIVVWATVLVVAVIVAIPALAQSVPPDTPVSKASDDELVQSKGPEAPSDVTPPPEAPPPEAPPPVAPSPNITPPEATLPEVTLPEVTLPDAPPPDSPPAAPSSDVPPPPDAPPPDIGEQKAVDQGEANEVVEGKEVGSRKAEEVEEQEIEDLEVEFEGIGKAGIGKAGVGKAGDPKQETEQDADSGDVDQSVDVINTGDNVNLCLGVLQAANTGNAQNAQGVVQDDSEADEVELEGGSSITITPQLIVDCRQIIYQIVMGQQPASGDRNAVLRGGGNVPGLGQLGIGTNRAALKVAGTSRGAGLSKAANTRRSLPRTGGGALLGLGAGVLLVAGGLAVRKVFR